MSKLEDTAYNYGAEVGTRKPRRIAELEAENDRLREALEKIANGLLERARETARAALAKEAGVNQPTELHTPPEHWDDPLFNPVEVALATPVTDLYEALKPFATCWTEEELDGASDNAPIEYALHEASQPTVGDLRRARAALVKEGQ